MIKLSLSKFNFWKEEDKKLKFASLLFKVWRWMLLETGQS